MADLAQGRRSSRAYSGGYKGWEPRCSGRNRECANHPGQRIGASGVCLIDHLEALAAAGDGPNAVNAQRRLVAAGWAT